MWTASAMEAITSVLLIALIAVLVFLGLSWILLVRIKGPTNIPGPTAWPIIGNAGYFLGVNNVERTLEAFTKMAQAHDAPLNRVWLGPKLVILVKSPKYMEALITHKAAATKDAFFYKGLKDLSGHGVFMRTGELKLNITLGFATAITILKAVKSMPADTTDQGREKWKRLRRPMMNIVLPKNIDTFQEILCQKVSSLCQDLDVEAEHEPFDISPYIKICALEILLETTMGTSNVEYGPDGRFGFIQLAERAIDEEFLRMWSCQRMLRLSKFNPEEIHNYYRHFLSKLLDNRREQLDLQGKNYITEKPKNYLDVILETAEIERLNRHETPILLIDFVIAGTDTQSVAMIVLLCLLAMHQDYQENVYQELVGIFGHSDREPEEEDLRRMVYLEMCIKEALRHCSPPAVFRAVDEEIEIDGYVIPKGSALLFSFYLVLKDPQYWERPGEFFPDHFLPEAVARRPKGTFMPFAAGPRVCPGQQYSFQTMKTLLSTLLRKFRFTTDQKYSELKYKYALMRVPVNSFVKLSKRLPLTESTLVS